MINKSSSMTHVLSLAGLGFCADQESSVGITTSSISKASVCWTLHLNCQAFGKATSTVDGDAYHKHQASCASEGSTRWQRHLLLFCDGDVSRLHTRLSISLVHARAWSVRASTAIAKISVTLSALPVKALIEGVSAH